MTKQVNVNYLQQRVTDLEAEVERLRGAIDEDCGFHRIAAEKDKLREALRRVVTPIEVLFAHGANDYATLAMLASKLATAIRARGQT